MSICMPGAEGTAPGLSASLLGATPKPPCTKCFFMEQL